MIVFVVASRKGGVGKTTLSGHLSVEAERQGHGPVAIIDMDEQGNLAEWWNQREVDTPLFARVGIEDLGDALDAMKEQGIRMVFIDTPPGMNEESRKILSAIMPHATVVVVPVRPSPHDLRAVGATVTIVEATQKPMVFVINGATPRAKIAGQAAIALSQHGTVAPVMIGQRVDFAASMTDGRTVQEVAQDSKSSKEIAELLTYLLKQARKHAKTQARECANT